MRIRSNRRRAAIAALAVLLAASGSFATSNTVPTSRAGDGVGGVSGYRIDLVRWTLVRANPTRTSIVRFRLDRRAREAFVRLPPAARWYRCTLNATGRNATCRFAPTVPVVGVTRLEVAAAA